MTRHFSMILRASAPSAALALAMTCAPALADKIKHPIAVFAGLDKITGRIIAFDVATDETVQFGTLQVTPRVCYTRPQTEAPQTDGFVEVEELTSNDEHKKIFSGWMFAASPGLHGVEHPVYDVWLTDCKGSGEVIRDVVSLPEETAPAAPAATPPAARSRREPRNQTSGLPPANALPSPGNGLPPPANVLPPAANTVPPPPPLSPQLRPRGNREGLIPPADIPNTGTAPRRAPSQSFFPAQPQDDRSRYRDD
jgi:hypothetical protein